MITPNSNFRVNPQRAIYVTGAIDRALVTALAPRILALQSASRDPITVYIDSPGGNGGAMESLLSLLRLSDQDSAAPCRIITAVTNQAASAAADLLSSGDYSVAYPTSSILYHGFRRQEDAPLTVELTALLGYALRLGNNRYAMELAGKTEDRFAFRFMSVRREFPRHRAQMQRALTDVECFVGVIEEKLSSSAQKTWIRARERHSRYRRLFETVVKKSRGDLGKKTKARIEADAIKAIVDFEVKANKNDANWSFSDGGIGHLADDFFLLNEYLLNVRSERVRRWAISFGRYVLSDADGAEIDAIQDQDQKTQLLVQKVEPVLEPLWSFFIALCHALQSGENDLTSYDAYWLGLIDEVAGTDLLSVRSFVEFTPDPRPAPQAPEPAPGA